MSQHQQFACHKAWIFMSTQAARLSLVEKDICLAEDRRTQIQLYMTRPLEDLVLVEQLVAMDESKA